MKNKNFEGIYVITIVLVILSFCFLSYLNIQEEKIKHSINTQIEILKSPIIFLNKIQYFYDRGLLEYNKKNPEKSLIDMEISKSFISAYYFQKDINLKNILKIINLTEQNIKNNKNFNFLKYQKNLYISVSNISHEYYSKTQDLIISLQNLLYKNKFNTTIIEISIIIITLLTLISMFFYKLKKIFKQEAYKDPLTQCYNRRYFYEKIKTIPKGIHSLIMLDIDHFKKINDTYGHETGDYILKETINIIKNNIRKNDIIIRWGGEEFIILLENVNKNKAFEIAQTLREQIASHNFNGIKITASFGVKEIKNKITNEDLKTLDNALYLSKRKGRNQVNILD